jgi:hypothetical protein
MPLFQFVANPDDYQQTNTWLSPNTPILMVINKQTHQSWLSPKYTNPDGYQQTNTPVLAIPKHTNYSRPSLCAPGYPQIHQP